MKRYIRCANKNTGLGKGFNDISEEKAELKSLIPGDIDRGTWKKTNIDYFIRENIDFTIYILEKIGYDQVVRYWNSYKEDK